jgi:hypothetical protein
MSNTHNKVAHAWAHQTGKNRTGFNMYYEGDTIYSYGQHFPIARHVRTEQGERAVLFTTDTYGVSTAKHKTITWRACHHLKVFNVPFVRARSLVEHQANYQALIASAHESMGKAKRARKYTDLHLNDAEQSITEANDYNHAFGLGHPIVEMVNLDAAIADMRARAAEVAKREQAEREARQRAERIRQRKAYNPDIVAWLDGASTYAPASNNAYGRRPFVRVKGDVVETSWGATVPKSQAIVAFRMAAKCRALGRTWEAGLAAPRVGSFALTKIGPTGNLVVGCHNIPYRHMKLAADRAGITLGEFGAWEAETVHPEANALRAMGKGEG